MELEVVVGVALEVEVGRGGVVPPPERYLSY